MFFRLIASLALATACLAQCSQDTVRGTWAAHFLGTVMVPPAGGGAAVATPSAQLVVAKIDWQGNLTGTGTIGLGQQLITTTLTGNIQVNADCTAATTYTLSAAGAGQLPGTGTERLLILNNGAEMRSMATKGVLGAQSGITYFRRISVSDAQCTQAMLHGVYGSILEGWWYPNAQAAAMSFSQIGVGTFGYGGKATVAATMAVGTSVVRTSYDGQITVNADCTAVGRYASGNVNQLVLLNDGDEFLVMPLVMPPGGGIALGVGLGKRISTMPVAPAW